MSERSRKLPDNMVPISDFNRGQSGKIFARVQDEGKIIVLKHNHPEAVILSPDAYNSLVEAAEDIELLRVAAERIDRGLDRGVPLSEVMRKNSITEADIEAAEDDEIE